MLEIKVSGYKLSWGWDMLQPNWKAEAKAEIWKSEKFRLNHVKLKSVKQIAGFVEILIASLTDFLCSP